MSTRVPLSAVALAVLGLCQGAYAQGAADSTLDPVAVEAPATPFRQLLGVEVTGTAPPWPHHARASWRPAVPGGPQ